MALAVVIVGGGEHARVVADAIRTRADLSLLGFVDPEPCEITELRGGMRRLGTDAALRDMPSAHAVLGVGPKPHRDERQGIVERLAGLVRGWAPVVHASAMVAPSVELGAGCVIMAGATIQPGARIGAHAVVNSAAVVDHDSEVGDFAHIAPGAVLGGGVVIGVGAYVGLAAAVRDHVRIGAGAVVGMGSVVVANVPDGSEVRGVPARTTRPAP